MNILWVTNSILPDLAEALNIKHRPFEGWLINLLQRLSQKDINLTVVTAQKKMGYHHHKRNGVNYFVLETIKNKAEYDSTLENQWKKVMKLSQPDLVHIHGSENAHGLALINTFPNHKYVLSIQGLILVYSRYYRAGLTSSEIYKNLTIRNILKRDSIISEEKWFRKRGNTIEKLYFEKAGNFIGRTSWDKAHTVHMSNGGNYFHCDEMLRNSFYETSPWEYQKCKPFSIFISQGNYPIKGMHQVLKAVALLKNDFPKIKLSFAGRDILMTNDSFKNRIKQKNYGKYLSNLVKKLDLSDNIEYLGMLNEEKMINAYKAANIFICPSSIENSPNSLAEAQILGVPCISSYVGGVPDMVEHNKTGLLYRFEEVEQLAEHIRTLFVNTNLAIEIGSNGKKKAVERHDKETIVNQTMNIYQSIISRTSID
ncbi:MULTISPECIES: glycosyltransferase family 4 protein [Flavobacteriaceae]|uniref:glycosyltransferase family 4 protein n=1 Tax=Flavobacteriaceae TaxID=49546 RepID=UPI00149259CD|nr:MULTISPECIES: glycosyltransferase family 4 protein [Allomuricauda]MDC6366865.1 glycosyltransferase family 4 protein [Muricauda sp. AC10]